jgi:hypothetical protein
MAVARFDAYKTLAYTGISAVYATVGSEVANNWRIFCITNNTNGDLAFSADGVTDNFFVPAYSFKLFDLSTNAVPLTSSDNFVLAIGTQFYVRYITAPSAGAVYVEGIYAKGIA